MEARKLCIVMVGLPARGKSVIANRLRDNLNKNGIAARIFNNGDLRRKLFPHNTAYAGFYDPLFTAGVELREKVALINIQRARRFLGGLGNVAILDATNVSVERRRTTAETMRDFPVLFIECVNDDQEILEASIFRKVTQPEFSHMQCEAAIASFKKRIAYYDRIYTHVGRDSYSFVRLDSFHNRILEEEIGKNIPFYDRIRDFVVTDTLRNLYLIRHGETDFNLENRIGGDPGLTGHGCEQAGALARHFQRRRIPIIFTSEKRRTIETADIIRRLQQNCLILPLREFNEIDAGVCECMTYDEIRERMPEVWQKRKQDKYNYVYAGGEGYATMRERIYRGIKKTLYLSSHADNIMIVGHRAVNRMILSSFLYRRDEDVPYIYIPQNKYYHIVATQDRKLFELKRFQPSGLS